MTAFVVRACRLGLAAGLIVAGVALASSGVWQGWRARLDNTAIAALAGGQVIEVAPDAAPLLLVAKARSLIAHGNLESAQAIADRLAATAPSPVRASLLYALGNANLRHGLDIYSKLPFRQVKPFLAQAKSEYHQALQLDPDNWDARYNFAVVAGLVRDAEPSQPSMGNEMSHERATWPDIPGAPNGMP